MRILSIQSSVAFGHVGNAAAAFALQRLGAEIHALNTVSFSNHPGHGDWTGRVVPAAELRDLLEGLARRGALAGSDAVLSGYLGGVDIADVVLEALRQVRSTRPDALYCCDPVMGDAGRLYVRPELPDRFRDDLLPQADLLTPNGFELALLSGLPCASEPDRLRAVDAVRARMRQAGPRVVLVTSAQDGAAPADTLDALAVDDRGAHRLRVPRLPVAASGAGDLTAALFLFHYLRTHEACPAAEAAIASVQGVLRRTLADGAHDLRLITAQAELIEPSERFSAETLPP